MNSNRYSKTYRQLGMLLLCAAIGLTSSRARTDDVKTRTKHVPMSGAPARRLPKDLVYLNVLHKWGLNAWWEVSTTRANMYEKTQAGNGLMVAFMSPEMIAARTILEAANDRLNSEDAQQLYEDNLKRYSGDKIAFCGYIQIDQFNYLDLDVINSDWTFTLITEEGKRYQPSRVEYGRSHYYDLNAEGTTISRKDVTISFDNLDPATRQPLFTSDTPSLTLAMSGKPGQIQARFLFNHRRK